MKIAYFDCFAGISGDMVLGALVDAGLSLDVLTAELKKIEISGYSLKSESVVKNGITGTKITVSTEESHHHRGLTEILNLIAESTLDQWVKESSTKAFERLAEVEAAIHNTTVDKIHFHEVGAVDAIVDIVGAMIGVHHLGFDKVYASRIHVGTGFVECAHGTIPIPAPATAALLKSVPTYSTGIEAELTTPTGAAIVTTLAESFGVMPEMTVEEIGYGAGSRDLSIPNLLRVSIGVTEAGQYETDTVLLIETNIDNMNPELYEHVFERLLAAGALDVFTTPITMKKSRPGIILSVLTPPALENTLLEIIFTETTTIGVRLQHLQRRKLSREIKTVETEYGPVQVKVASHGDRVVNVAPEYEDCKKIAEEKGIPIQDVYDAAKRAADLT